MTSMTFFLLKQLTVRNTRRLLDAGLISCVDLLQFANALQTAGQDVWNLNAYEDIGRDGDDLLDLATEADLRLHHQEPLSILDGIPISIKANIAVSNKPLTAGSNILQSSNNVGYDADVVALLKQKGCIITGITSMDEFGMGSLGNKECKNPLPLLRHLELLDLNEHHKTFEERLAALIKLPTDIILERHEQALQQYNEQNDPDVHYSAGGSSCGSAVTVCHGSALLSLGTDTGGSVRLPAAWCGVVGMKPSYGLLSRHGIVSYASSFDTVGILGKSSECTAIALDVLAQRDVSYSRDSTFSSYNSNHHPYHEVAVAELSTKDSEKPLSGLTVGIPEAFSVQECPEYISKAWSKTAAMLEARGATITSINSSQISPEIIQHALSAYYVLTSAEASSNLSRYDGFRYGNSGGDGGHDNIDNPNTTTTSVDDYTPLERQYAFARSNGFGMEVQRRILCGNAVLSSDKFHTYYESAAILRATLAEQLCKALDSDVDILLIPTVLSLPPTMPSTGDNDGNNDMDNTAMFANDVMTTPASLAGLPSMSVPVALEDMQGADNPATATPTPFLSCGMQLIAGRLNEAVLFQCAQLLGETQNGKPS